MLRDAGVRKARISVAVVDDETIARLNWRYLRHRGPADVLSFLLDQSDGLEGEVVVGAQTALRTAPRYGWPPHDELLLYVDPRHVAPGGPRRRQPGHADNEMQKRETDSIGETWNQTEMSAQYSVSVLDQYQYQYSTVI